MAIYENTVWGKFNDFADYLHDAILNGSMSASYEDGCTYRMDGRSVLMRVYERYSYMGGNRVSLSVMLAEESENTVRICAVTSGGSQAMFFKVNTWGEEAFLGKLQEAVENYKS